MADKDAVYKDSSSGEMDEVVTSKYSVTTTPTNEAGVAKVYAKDVSGTAKMHAIDSAGAEILLGGATPSMDTLTSSGGNVAVDADNGPNYELELTEATTELNNPTNLAEGQNFFITIKQDVTGSRSLTFGTDWLKKDGLTSGIAAAANTVTILRGQAVSLPNGPGLRIYYTLDHEEETGGVASHASTHISGGGDEIDGDQLDIDWNPANYTPTTAPSEATSLDHLTAHLAGIDTALTVVSSHASDHISGGGDEIDGDQLDIDWNPANYTPTTAPSEATSLDHLTAHLAGIDAALTVVASHASTHISGGGDEIDGDQLDIDWNPTNYTPTTAPTEATSVDHLTAHLAGIDTALGGGGGGAFGIDATLQTVNATPATIHTVATSSNQVTVIEGMLFSRDNTANETAFYKFTAVFDNNAGTVSQKGSTTVLDSYEDDASWDFDFNISGTNIEIQVQGDATNNVEWRLLANTGAHG
jgi:hypothetical protein